MRRRDVLRLLGATVVPALAGMDPDRLFAIGAELHERHSTDRLRALTPEQAELVGGIADLILPRTDTPGATDVGVPAFVDLIMAEWYTESERVSLQRGMAEIDRLARETGGVSFARLGAARQTALASDLDGAADRPAGSAAAAFRDLKGLTIYGYFTSEPVIATVLRTPVVPGRWAGCEHV